MAEYDKASGGNGDGVIDAKDKIFADLRLWQDAKHNGVSEREELRDLQSQGIVALHLRHMLTKQTDQYGNSFKYRAKVDDAKGDKAGRWAWDVFLLSAP